MKTDSFIELLMGRGLCSDLAQRIVSHFPNWEAACSADSSHLAEQFTEAEIEAIDKAKKRRDIPKDTVKRLIDECEFRCCLCWNIDSDSGVIIHHVRLHASAPDDRYENLVVLCTEHHDRVHTTRELTRHPYPPELLLRRKEEFAGAIAAFKAGNRVGPGREKNVETGLLVAPPLPSRHFVGRDVLTRDIIEVLESRSGRAAIVGMGGIGKTALALKVADVCRQNFPGGVLWAEVATDFGGIPEMLRGWIRSMGQDIEGLEIDEQLSLFGRLLTKRVATHGHLLLLIDDVAENVVKDLVELTSYVPPDASILITTREATVGVAFGASQFRIEALDRADSRELLESLSGSARVRTEESSVDRLLSLLGDLPLAIELVARQIAVRESKPEFSIAGLCRRLGEFNSKILSFPGHRGIAMSFALSYEHLSENEQQVFRSFGVFAFGPLRTVAVAAVTTTGEEETEEILDRLVVVSMLNWGAGVGDYRIHPLLHKYSEFLLDQTDDFEQRATRIRFHQHYTTIARAVAKNDPRNLGAIDQILPNLTRAIHGAAANGDHSSVAETVLRLCVGMSFFMARNLDRESMPLLEMAAISAKHLEDLDGESACIGHLGTACARLGIIRDAIGHFERAIAIARKTGNDFNLASHLQNLGNTLLSEATDLQRAERLLHEALAAAQRSHNVDAVIGCLSTLGSLHRGVGNLNEASRLYSAALEAARLAGDRLAEGNDLSNLGLVNDQLGNSAEGERMIREALAIAVEIGDKRGEGNRNGHLGGILFAKAMRLPPGSEQSGILEIASELITVALGFAQETGDAEKAGSWQMNLGSIYTFEGKFAEGISQYKTVLGVAMEGGFARLEAEVRFNLGLALVPLGEREAREALDHFSSSSALLQKMGSPMVATVESYIDRLNAILTKKNTG